MTDMAYHVFYEAIQTQGRALLHARLVSLLLSHPPLLVLISANRISTTLVSHPHYPFSTTPKSFARL